MLKQQNIRGEGCSSHAAPFTATIISTPKGKLYASKHGKDIDAGIAFLRQLNGDTAMIAFVTAPPNMCFIPQNSTIAPVAQELSA